MRLAALGRWAFGALAVTACIACTAPDPGQAPVTAPPRSLVPLPVPIESLGPLHGRLGRGDAAAAIVPVAIAGPSGLAALHDVAVWQLPGGGSARAIASSGSAVELVDVDGGAVRWRVAAPGRVVVMTPTLAVLADDAGMRGVAVADGAEMWKRASVPVVATAERIVVAAGSGVDVIDTTTGSATDHVALPANLAANDVVASCPDDAVFAHAPAIAATRTAAAVPPGLVRVVAGKLAWRVAEADLGGRALAVDGCDTVVLVTAGTSLVALARATGAIGGRATGVRGWWPTPGAAGSIDIATAAGVWRRPRDLSDAGEVVPELPALGERIASHGDRVLVRATPRTAALLDRDGVRAIVPLAEATAALGDAAIVAGGETLRAFALPVAVTRDASVPAIHPGVAIAAELRDLPAVQPLDDSGAVVAPGSDDGSSVEVALDDADPTAVYGGTEASVGRFATSTKTWSWHRDVGCSRIAVARDVVACASAAEIVGLGAVDGATRWTAALATTALVAAGDTIIAFGGARATLLAAATGRIRGELASDDGGTVVATPVALHGRAPTTLVFAAMRGRLVAFVPAAAMVPLWSLAIAGTATRVSAAGDGVIVELEGGDAYRVDADGDVTALPALGQTWRGDDDALEASCAGGPVPPDPMPVPPPPLPAAPATATSQSPSSFENLPPMSVPWPPPPPMAASWELSIYDIAGALRARNDYALVSPVAIAPRAAAAPVVVASAPHRLLVLDSRTGDPMRRVDLPDAPAAAFATIVAGTANTAPITGVVLAHPLRVVVF